MDVFKVDTKVLEDLKNNLTEALKEIDCLFDKFHESLDKCLSEGVEKSVRLSVTTAETELIKPVSIITFMSKYCIYILITFDIHFSISLLQLLFLCFNSGCNR